MIWLWFFLFIVVGVVIALLINKFVKNKYKYLVSLLPLFLSIYALTQIKGVEGFSDIGNFLLFLFFIIIFISLIITLIVIDLKNGRNKI